MDLWTAEVQEIVLTFVTGLLGVLGAIVLAKLQGYYTELKAETRERVADIAHGALVAAFDTAVRAAEEWAHANGNKIGAEKFAKVAAWARNAFDDLTEDQINTLILAAVHRMNYGWEPLKSGTASTATRVATTITQATVEDVAERAAEVIARAEQAARNLQAITDGLKADGGGDQ